MRIRRLFCTCFGNALRRSRFGLSWEFRWQIRGFGDVAFKIGSIGMVVKRGKPSIANLPWCTLFSFVVWSIWRKRNSIVFRNNSGNPNLPREIVNQAVEFTHCLIPEIIEASGCEEYSLGKTSERVDEAEYRWFSHREFGSSWLWRGYNL